MVFIKSVIFTFTTWVLTALINALLGGTWLYLFSKDFGHFEEAFGVIFFCTILFSIPGFFIFWIVLLAKREDDLLFRSLLQTGLLLSIVSSLLLYVLPLGDAKSHRLFLALFIVIASLTSIMIHHRAFKSFSNQIHEGHASIIR